MDTGATISASSWWRTTGRCGRCSCPPPSRPDTPCPGWATGSPPPASCVLAPSTPCSSTSGRPSSTAGRSSPISRGRSQGGGPPALDRLLVAWDGRAATDAAARWAAEPCAEIGAELVVARVLDPGQPPATPARTVRGGRSPGLVDECRAELDRACARTLGPGVRARAVVLVGETASMLLALAESEGAGGLVVGVQRRSARWRSGDLAFLVARGARRPVVLVPPRR